MPTNRYSTGAMILHWAIAIAVIVSWRVAESAEHLAREEKEAVMGNHMALGMIILVLTVVRLAWRLTHAQPPLPVHLARWEAALARTIHVIFYVLLVGLPLAGWIGTSMEREGFSMFGLFEVPLLPAPDDRRAGHELLEVHGTAGTIMIYLIGLHILGALKHHFWDKDGMLWRMLPFGTPKG